MRGWRRYCEPGSRTQSNSKPGSGKHRVSTGRVIVLKGIVSNCISHKENAACHQHKVVVGVGGGAGGTDGFAHCGKSLSRHIATGCSFGKSGNWKSPRHGGLSIVICGAVVGEHPKYLHVVLVVDTTVDEMQAFVGKGGELVEHCLDTVGIVGGLADGEGSAVELFPTAMKTSVGHHAGDAALDMLQRNRESDGGQQLQCLEEGGEVVQLVTATERG